MSHYSVLTGSVLEASLGLLEGLVKTEPVVMVGKHPINRNSEILPRRCISRVIQYIVKDSASQSSGAASSSLKYYLILIWHKYRFRF